MVGAAVHQPDQAGPAARHTIGDLASRARLSPRQLQRRFTAEIGVGPAQYVERVRVEAARRALAGGNDPVDAVARRCGFGSAESLRRARVVTLVGPGGVYRDRFGSLREYA